MLQPLIEAIQAAVKPEIIEMQGLEYNSRKLYLPPEEPKIDPVRLSTLSGFADYIKSQFDSLDECMVHVCNHEHVELVGKLQGDRYWTREIYAIAALSTTQPSFGRYLPAEKFVIELMTNFVDTPERAALLKIIGNLKHDASTHTNDDGVTQTATVKTGVVLAQESPVTPIRILSPYRTFREVEQPFSAFLLRIKQEKDGPYVALFEADGGAWKLDAVSAIATWLHEHLEDALIIA